MGALRAPLQLSRRYNNGYIRPSPNLYAGRNSTRSALTNHKTMAVKAGSSTMKHGIGTDGFPHREGQPGFRSFSVGPARNSFGHTVPDLVRLIRAGNCGG